jgi:hypothetical protein
MKEMTLELFLHGNGQPQVVPASPDETLRQLLARLDALPKEGQFVFVGEADEAVYHPEADSDCQEPANLDLSLEQLELHKLRHVHIKADYRVEVTVYFNGHHKHSFSPAATVATVTVWAKKRFNIDPSAGAELVLALRPSGTQPRPDQHLGELMTSVSCELLFDLVREVTPQGY